MARLMVAITIEKTGSSFKGRLMIKSKIIPNITAKMIEPKNASKKTQPFISPTIAEK